MKYKVDDSLDKYKTRLVAKGFAQNYEEIFAPTEKMVTIRLVTALAAQFRWKLFQTDVKSAFLNRDLEEVYMVNLKVSKLTTIWFAN